MKSIVYAIIVTYNGSKWIDKCFGSLVNSTIPIKILAIDNASTDGTPDKIRVKFPQVEVIETGANLGFGKANNIGLKRVLEESADYAFLLNQDAWVEKDTIEKLTTTASAHKEIGILSPVPLNGDGTDKDYLFRKYYQHTISPLKQFTNETYEIDFINAAGWLVKAEVIQTIGGFHPKFTMHGEDVNYVSRMKYKEKFKIAISLDTCYYHDRGERESTENTEAKIMYALESRIKTQMYNPLESSILLLIKSTAYIGKRIMINGDLQSNIIEYKLYLKYFIQSIFNRQIKYKL